MQIVTDQIRDFLQFISLQFIKHPEQAQLKVVESTDNHVRFRLILNQSDVAILIGKNGFTASTIRNVLKAAAMREGITATLQITSHEEEHQRLTALKEGKIIDDKAHTETGGEPECETDDDSLEESLEEE